MRFTGSILNKIFLLWTNFIKHLFSDLSTTDAMFPLEIVTREWNPENWNETQWCLVAGGPSIRCNDSLWLHCEVNSSPLSELIIEAIKANIHDMPCHPLCALVLGKYWKPFEGGTQQLTIAWSCSALKSSDRRQDRGWSLNRKWLPGQCRVICS